MHRSNSLKRDVPSQRSSRIGGFPEAPLREHRTGLPYVPSTPSTRSSSSRSGGGSVPSPRDRDGGDPYRPQLSGAPSLGRQKILSHRSPLRQAGSPMRQQASPPSKMMMHPSSGAPKEASLDPHRPRTSPGWKAAPHDYEEEERVPRRPSPLRRIPSARRNARAGEPLDRHSAAGSGRSSSNHNSSNHSSSQSRSARPLRRSPAKQPSFATTASLSSASSASQQRQQLLRPNIATSDASSFRVDASSFRTASTLSGGGGSSRYLDRHSRNSRRTTTHSVPEEAYVCEEEEYDDAASFNEEYEEEDEAHFYTHPHYEKEEENEDPFLMMNASFVSIDFGSTVGVAPPMPPMLSQKPSAQQQRRGGGYHHEEAEYDDDDRWHDYAQDEDDALLFHEDDDYSDEEDHQRPPPPVLSESQNLERAVRRGSSLATSGYQEAAAVASQFHHPVRVVEPRVARNASAQRNPRGKVNKAASHGDIHPPPQQRRSSVSKSSSQGAMPTNKRTGVSKPSLAMQRDAAVSRRRSSLQHNPQLAASYRPPVKELQRSRSYDEEDLYAVPNYGARRPGMARTLSQPDLFDWKDDVDDMSFSDLAVRKR